jgi:hypothetical protein
MHLRLIRKEVTMLPNFLGCFLDRGTLYSGKTNLFVAVGIFQLHCSSLNRITFLMYYLSVAKLRVNIFLQSKKTHEPTENLYMKF